MILLGIVLAVLATPAVPDSASEPVDVAMAGLPHAPACGGHDVETLLAKLNVARHARGLRPLALDPLLCAVARSHGRDMASRGYFDHTTPEGVTPFARFDRAHVRYSYAGENLALERDVAAAHDALLRSNEHRGNMLEPHFARVGIAAVASSAGEIVVEDFSD